MMTQIDILLAVARQAMIDRDLLPDFSAEVLAELSHIEVPASIPLGDAVKDLRHFLWFSIDNDDSKDLDQLTCIEGGKAYVAIADVEILVKRESPIDRHAAYNTRSVYTPSKVFSMLPEKLSTDLSSLNPDQGRFAMVVEMSIDPEGALQDYLVYPAYVHSHAKLAYNSVTDWLDGKGSAPAPIANRPDLQNQLHLHDELSKKIKSYRQSQGELTLETTELQLVIVDGEVKELQETQKNRARQIIETFMISANTAATHFLKRKGYPILKRVLSAPKRWDRIVSLAAEASPGEKLPNEPNSKALELFLLKQKNVDPLNFHELSLTIIKSLGRGEYLLERAGEQLSEGHFALALQDYSHVTAPNRLYLDLVIQRMLKAAIKGDSCPYTNEELDEIAKRCTRKEVDAEKVERRVKKSAAAMLVESLIGSTFEGIVTGAGMNGTWVKVFKPAIEGKLVQGFEGVDIGDRIRVRLLSVNIREGFIDFNRA
jgi:VacB/RNase II family 3'-5' exoribonuclease